MQDSTAERSTFIVRSTDGTNNVEGWQVAYDNDSLVNATELTLAKAATGTAVTNDVLWVKSDKINHVEVDNRASVPITNKIGVHPSTLTYGWTVTKMDKAELDTLDTTWTHVRKSTQDKPFQLFSVKSVPILVEFANPGEATIDTTGAFKAGSKVIGIYNFLLALSMSGEEANE